MIPIIGLIIGLYAIVRYAEMMSIPSRHSAIKGIALVAILLTGLLMAGLIMSSIEAPTAAVGDMYRF